MDQGDRTASFEYTPAYATSGIQVATLMMPLSRRIYRLPELSFEAFHGLTGLLADSLPDRFGNALINAWLAIQGRPPESFNAVERLCYIGTRGIGALEFAPAPTAGRTCNLRLDRLVELASEILSARSDLHASLTEKG